MVGDKEAGMAAGSEKSALSDYEVIQLYVSKDHREVYQRVADYADRKGMGMSETVRQLVAIGLQKEAAWRGTQS